MNPYDDIIDRPHHTSPSRPPMSAHDRAAQFAPFAALTGFGSAISETARLTDTKLELDEDRKTELNEKLGMIQDQIDQQKEVAITYFQPDPLKSGGAYLIATGCVKKIDPYERMIILQDTTKILIDDIVEIEGSFLDMLDY